MVLRTNTTNDFFNKYLIQYIQTGQVSQDGHADVARSEQGDVHLDGPGRGPVCRFAGLERTRIRSQKVLRHIRRSPPQSLF